MRKPCEHGVVLPKGLNCQRGYLMIFIIVNKRKYWKGCGPHTPAHEKAAYERLDDMRYYSRAGLPLNFDVRKRDKTKQTTHQKKREAMLLALGGQCRYCKETNTHFLTLDHVRNDGAKERKKVGNNSKSVLNLAFKRRFNKRIYQILCMNCNWARARNQGICPHRIRRAA